jgi:rfaE bifunctional protein nucleotidyltransferase chain/domain
VTTPAGQYEPMTLGECATLAASCRQTGRRVVFTNGVFDLLHPGHIRYLQAARAEGDVLIVAINSNRLVAGNKGPDRPVTTERERAELLAALACVDAVMVFDEPTPADVVRAILPDVLVKGADWAADAIVGRGGRVVRVTVEPGWSTTSLLQKVRTAS